MESVAVQHKLCAKVQKIKSADFNLINIVDTKHFGFNRDPFLKGWLTMPESLALKYNDNTGVRVYGVIRKCRSGFKIGPLFADSYAVADELFKGLSSFAVGEKAYLDIPEINKEALQLARSYQMKECFGYARMYLGPAPKLPYEKTFGGDDV